MTSRQVKTLPPGSGDTTVPILSPQSGSTAAPVNALGTPPPRSPHSRPRGLSSPSISFSSHNHTVPRTLLAPVLHSSSRSETSSGDAVFVSPSYSSPPFLSISSPAGSSPSLSTSRFLLSPPSAMQMRSAGARSRSRSRDAESSSGSPASPFFRSRKGVLSASPKLLSMKRDSPRPRKYSDVDSAASKAASKAAQAENDSMVYLEGPCVYTCGQCRTHLTSHDDIISKSFHGRHGRAYLFDHCVNVTTGPAEDRLLITGMHSVCDIFCKRCKTLVGWTYAKAYESSQKYKEGKFIVEKINLYLEESQYDVSHPAGERGDRWRKRSMSWGSDRSMTSSPSPDDSTKIIFEYKPGATTAAPYEYSPHTPRSRKFLGRTLSAPPASQRNSSPTSPGSYLPGPPPL